MGLKTMIPLWMQTGMTPNLGEWSGKITFTAGATTSSTAGGLQGYSRPGWYNAATPAGTIQTDLFVDRRDAANPKTIRLMGIVNQGGNFLVIGWKLEPTIPPSAMMPSMSGSLRINGYALALIGGAHPGVEPGNDGLYWAGVQGAGILAGNTYTFEFS